ncbi:S-adenosyl methyltransferase [Amycolatopsis arida]|uniref:S-adenosyl methyltransferase n=1 Tax=Amycolatopsis arida TaxID=587909 RepID=A0A1I5T0D3_9PSEU|nr:SAM-dependent methyltransferase [Amycolatopsis arida]TDX96294.1 S-adenosyl methyltransferase [Amycolatopsis arida]SFP75916.1 S-adenosyl methyltransferase [Amycolatopsis arida]
MPGTPTRSDPKPPVGVDPTRASIARVYDAFLNGKDNYEIDREVLRGVQKAAPEAQDLATENRGFLIRASRFLAEQTGITQYLDCGSGLPTAENTHQVVQRIQPESTVVYVDNDPVVIAHGRALLVENELTHFSDADIFNPPSVLKDPVVRRHLDFSEPIALLQLGTLHHYTGERNPADIMQEYVDALPSGSYIAISHFLDPENEHSTVARKMEHMFLHSPMGSGKFRTKAELEELFCGLEMVEPGLVLCADWWPDGPRLKPLNQVQYCIAGGVARKP